MLTKIIILCGLLVFWAWFFILVVFAEDAFNLLPKRGKKLKKISDKEA